MVRLKPMKYTPFAAFWFMLLVLSIEYVLCELAAISFVALAIKLTLALFEHLWPGDNLLPEGETDG